MEKQVALITGASSGFGLLTTIELAKSGIFVVATVQNINDKDNLVEELKKNNLEENAKIIQLDITNYQELERVKEYVLTTYKSIDFLINIAGYSMGGAAEDVSMDEYKKQFDTNLFGTIALTKAFIPSMRENRRGRIINMGSISGSLALPGLTPYASSKFALRGFSEALRLELLPFNVYVSLIEPGNYKTGIWEKGLKEMEEAKFHPDYQKMMDFAKKGSILAKDNSEDPIHVANLIKKIVFQKKPDFYYPIGKGIKTMLFLKKFLPHSVLENILIKPTK